MARGLPLLLVALALVTDTTCVSIGVIEEDPMRARETQAAVQAVLGKNDQVRLAGLEPGAVAALPHEFCRLAYEGVVGVISGATGAGSAVVRAAAARAGVPLFLTSDARASAAALPLPPHPRHVAAAAAALVRAKGWRRGVLVQEGGVGGAALLGGRAALTARVLPADPALLRNLLLLLKRGGERHVLVWASAERSAALLDAAQRAGMLDQRHVYLLLDLDLHTQSLANYSYAGANITGLRLFEPEAPAASIALDAWGRQLDERPQPEDAPTRVVLAVDAANLTLRAVSHLRLPNISDANCGTGEAAFHADTLLNYLRSEEWEGASGALAWTRDGARDAARLAVRELAAGGALAAAGRWLPGAGLRWTRPQLPAPPSPSDSMTNRTFTILIAENEPYVMKQESTHRLSGNQRYEGFCIELIAHLANQLGFNYTFEEQRDKQYGSFNNLTNTWNGMLGRLLQDKDIHFAITDLTITEQREKIVDFTTPFMNLGISILFHTPLPPKPKIFAFLLPFSNDVWICLGMSYLLTSLVLWIVGRLCPAEWVNPHPCVEDPPTLHNQFTLPNALWFNLGAVLLQGSEIAPVGYGTRAVASVWWVFALVITSSYTANLATLLAKKSSTELISNVDDLVNNTYGITYGAKKGGSTMDFFAQATSGTYKLMYQHMMEHPENLPTDNKEGIDRVNNAEGSYAFLMESTTIEYATERNCNITQVGALLDNKGYGIAMRKNSPYRQELSLALLNLQEQGVLREMKRTWWKEKHGGGACSGKESYESEKLDMDNFLGLWLVLVVGCALGVVMSLADLALAARRRRLPTETFLQRLALELRFVFRFHLSVKPVNGPLLSSSGTSTTEEADSGREEAESGRGEAGSARDEAGSGRNTADDGRRADAAGGRDTAERGRDAAWSRRASRRSSLAAADARRRRHSRRS